MSTERGPIENTTTTVWIEDDGTVVIRSNGVLSTAATVRETLDSVRLLTGGVRAPLLIDARKWTAGDPGALQTMVSQIGDLFTAAVMVVAGDRPPALGSFPDMVDRLVIPFRLVSTMKEARDFLADHAP